MKSPLYNYKNRFLFLNIWKTTAVEALGFFRPRALGAYWTAVALNECLRLAPVLFVFTLIHLPVGVLLLWLLMTLFPASNDFSEPLMKGLGISAQKHSVPFVLSLSKSTKQNTKHTHARVWRIIISDLLLTFPFHVHLGLLHPAPLLPFTVFTLWHGLQAVQGRSERRGLGIDLFFLPPFFVSKERPTAPEAPSSKYRTQRQEQGDILFSDFITPRMLGAYSNSLSPDMHGEGCDYVLLSCSALI